MITSENLKEVIQTISQEDLDNAISAPNDYIKLELHIFNTGGFGTIESTDYDEDDEKKVIENGNIYASKDDFIRICDELEIFEY